jgi:hypothetical protein
MPHQGSIGAAVLLTIPDRQKPAQNFDTQRNPPAAWCERGIVAGGGGTGSEHLPGVRARGSLIKPPPAPCPLQFSDPPH